MSFKKNSLISAFDAGVRRCPICNVQMVWKSNPANVQKNLATVDHIVPRSIGGADIPANMFVMCRTCNKKRGADCFVEYVTKAGISISFAEELYKTAHITTLQTIIFNQFVNSFDDKKTAMRVNKKRRNLIRSVIKNYTDYFGDYLPEFQLLQRFV